MTIANVRYISNGYIVGGNVPTAPALQSVYASTIPEVVYWLGRIFDPLTGAAVAFEREAAAAPRIIAPADDPLLGQRANVETIASGGFLVTQVPGMPGISVLVEVYAANMDEVSALLTEIFTAPPPPPPPPEESEAPSSDFNTEPG